MGRWQPKPNTPAPTRKGPRLRDVLADHQIPDPPPPIVRKTRWPEDVPARGDRPGYVAPVAGKES